MTARYLTSADVARRLDVEPGTVRHYGEVLRGLGFPMPQDQETGAYLWSPELVEVAHVAYRMAKAYRGISFEDAVRLILYAAEVVPPAREGRSILGLLHRVLALPQDLERAREDFREASTGLKLLAQDLSRDLRQEVQGLREDLLRGATGIRDLVEEARAMVQSAQSGGWVPLVATLLLGAAAILPRVLEGPTIALTYLGAIALGAFLGWWARG